jgi:hypothetical protein
MAYGFAEHIYPVLILHIVLLPINISRLRSVLNAESKLPSIPFGFLKNSDVRAKASWNFWLFM